MNKITLIVGLMLLIGGLAWAEPASMPSATVTGTIGKPSDAKVAATLGHNGVLFIRSEARWKEFSDRLGAAIPINAEMPKFDFAKQSVVLIYADARRPKDAFSLTNSDNDLRTDPSHLSFLLNWDNSVEKQREERSAKFILVVIPATPTARVSLFSSPAPKAETNLSFALTEFSAILGGKDGDDIVDGLQAAITPKAATIKPGEDIQIDFELHLASMPDAHPQQFGSLLRSDYIWNAAGSAGYCNYKFFVISPDGKTTVLRPKEITIWHDNPVNLIEITAKAPYSLPKSLKDFGLDTSTPGTYIITGLYEESGDKGTRPDGGKAWGGSIASNTITVEVKK